MGFSCTINISLSLTVDFTNNGNILQKAVYKCRKICLYLKIISTKHIIKLLAVFWGAWVILVLTVYFKYFYTWDTALLVVHDYGQGFDHQDFGVNGLH